MNAIHSRAKAYRDIYRARPVSKDTENDKRKKDWFEQTAKMVNQSHAEFWKKRGKTKPPRVSKKKLNVFDLPSDSITA